MSLSIRRAVASDLPAITRIYNEGIATRMATADSEPRTLEERGQWFRMFSDQFPIWVGEEGRGVACYGSLAVWSPRFGYRMSAETSVYVGAEARGRGFGRAMMENVLSEARRLGFHYLIARVFSDNVASVNLHKALGFEILGTQREVAHLDGQWRDVHLMDRRL